MLALLLFYADQLRENLEPEICANRKKGRSFEKGSILVENYRHSVLLLLPFRDGGSLNLLPSLLIWDMELS